MHLSGAVTKKKQLISINCTKTAACEQTLYQQHDVRGRGSISLT